ncbi:MAG: helix-turn-helix transcriptional regulator [Bryobacterales bacterium]|nr:helix-turn-helix transcriptional regulator [Bryobacterales bacterium]
MNHNVKVPTLGEFEVLVLTGVIAGKRAGDAYGVTIHEEVEKLVTPTRDVSIGSVYTTLDRLQQKGLVQSWYAGKTDERGGRAKRCFEVTGIGNRALRAALLPMQKALDIVQVE